jgi:UDP-N-acetyl-D-mannosaminuronic acid dehydrogenase
MLNDIARQARERSKNYSQYPRIIAVDEDGKFVDVVLHSELVGERIEDRSIAVLGLGPVGLTLACILANNGFLVAGIDHDQEVIDQLNRGVPHFYEKGMESLLSSVQRHNPIRFTADPFQVDADVYIVCVGTPLGKDKKANLEGIREVTRTIANKLKKDDLIIYRSTVPLGTTRHTVLPLLEANGLNGGKDFYLCFAPERTVEGNALEELQTLPQIIGGVNQESTKLAADLFAKVTPTIIEVKSLEAAEMVKLMNNTFRDIVFSFANEVANICEELNFDAFRLIDAANEGYPRDKIPRPSPGVGGTCLSKDPYFFSMPQIPLAYKPLLGIVSRRINNYGHKNVCNKIRTFCRVTHKSVNEVRIYIIGLAFKGSPETSDIRDSATLQLLKNLPNKRNISIKDFVVDKTTIHGLDCNHVDDIMKGFENADIVMIMNNHFQNSKFNVAEALGMMNRPALFFDAWHMFDQDEIESYDDVYYATVGYMTNR